MPTEFTLEKLKIDERLRLLELQVSRLVAHTESEAGNLASILAGINKSLEDSRIDFKDHKKDDMDNFKVIRDQIGKHAMWIYMALGALAVIRFFIK